MSLTRRPASGFPRWPGGATAAPLPDPPSAGHRAPRAPNSPQRHGPEDPQRRQTARTAERLRRRTLAICSRGAGPVPGSVEQSSRPAQQRAPPGPRRATTPPAGRAPPPTVCTEYPDLRHSVRTRPRHLCRGHRQRTGRTTSSCRSPAHRTPTSHRSQHRPRRPLPSRPFPDARTRCCGPRSSSPSPLQVGAVALASPARHRTTRCNAPQPDPPNPSDRTLPSR